MPLAFTWIYTRARELLECFFILPLPIIYVCQCSLANLMRSAPGKLSDALTVTAFTESPLHDGRDGKAHADQ